MRKRKWVKLQELPRDMRLDGHRVRYKKHVLGFIRAAWGRGLWIVENMHDWGAIRLWFPPEGTLKDAAPHLEIEVTA